MTVSEQAGDILADLDRGPGLCSAASTRGCTSGRWYMHLCEECPRQGSMWPVALPGGGCR